ncbi:elongation factor G, partial [Enterococcus faecium]|nr:elongation factor G [Enterococcus faecium]
MFFYYSTLFDSRFKTLQQNLSGKSLEALELEQEEIRRFQNCSLYPVYHGSAKSNIGIEQLI